MVVLDIIMSSNIIITIFFQLSYFMDGLQKSANYISKGKNTYGSLCDIIIKHNISKPLFCFSLTFPANVEIVICCYTI